MWRSSSLVTAMLMSFFLHLLVLLAGQGLLSSRARTGGVSPGTAPRLQVHLQVHLASAAALSSLPEAAQVLPFEAPPPFSPALVSGEVSSGAGLSLPPLAGAGSDAVVASDVPEDTEGGVGLTPYYYQHADLDVPPYPLLELPELPPGGQDFLTPGTLQVEVWVDDVGRVRRVDVLASDLPDELVALMAAAVREQPFAPGVRQGIKVFARIKGELRYSPKPLPVRLRK